MSSYEILACELYYLHGIATEAIGGKKNVIAEDYKKAISKDILSEENIQGTSLLWLFQNMNTDYNNVINSLLDKNSNYFKAIIVKTETMIANHQAQDAIKFLEGNIASYQKWQKEHPYDEVIAEDILPEIYFQLAKSKEAEKLSQKDIAEAYCSTFNSSSYDYIPQRTHSLIWLIENNMTDELERAVKSFTQEQDIKQYSKDVVSNACKQFESEKDVEKFQSLLGAILNTAKYPSDWANFIESCITDKTSRWAKVYYSSIEDNPRLKFGVDCKEAERLISEENYKEAAELYADILTRCGPDDDKGELEFSRLKCLFDGGFYIEAVAEIKSFISGDYRKTNQNRVKEAILMQGRALIQLGETDKAIDVFSSLMIEYPETAEMPETTFFVGYCYMLQEKLNEATEAFEIVSESYPDSTYANQARLLITRIKSMSRETHK